MPSLVSYAQNFEDIMLWRALGHVEHGCYVDIGAHDPTKDSVSRLFYEHGWRGLHCEPSAHYAALLRAARPDEVVLNAAISSADGVTTLYEIENTGLSTCERDVASAHSEQSFEVKEQLTPCVTLDTALSQWEHKDIHWLKIDVEGHELDVLTGWRNPQTRPWIVVVESTRPLSQIENYESWQPLLTNRGYDCVYFDGLNRFFVASEHADLARQFKTPPNVFDGFTLSGGASSPFTQSLEAELEASRNEQRRLVDELQATSTSFGERLAQLQADEERIKSALSSTTVQLEQIQRDSVVRERDLAMQLDGARRETTTELRGLQQQSNKAIGDFHERLQRVEARNDEVIRATAQLGGEIGYLKDRFSEVISLFNEMRIESRAGVDTLRQVVANTEVALTAEIGHVRATSIDLLKIMTTREQALRATMEEQRARMESLRDQLLHERDRSSELAAKVEHAAQAHAAAEHKTLVANESIHNLSRAKGVLETDVARLKGSLWWRIGSRIGLVR